MKNYIQCLMIIVFLSFNIFAKEKKVDPNIKGEVALLKNGGRYYRAFPELLQLGISRNTTELLLGKPLFKENINTYYYKLSKEEASFRDVNVNYILTVSFKKNRLHKIAIYDNKQKKEEEKANN